MPVNIVYQHFRGNASERALIEQAVVNTLSDARDEEWQVTIDEYLSAPVYSIEISGSRIILRTILSKGADISTALRRSFSQDVSPQFKRGGGAASRA
jgi:hypothetical protein